MVGKTALNSPLVELRIIQGAERPRQSPERPDQPELGGDDVNDKPGPHLLHKRDTILDFALRLGKRGARREQVYIPLVAAIDRAREIADLVGGLERAAYQLVASPDMSRPWQDVISQGHIGHDLEAPQSPLFDQVVAELAEAHSGLVVAEMQASDHAKH